MYTFTSTTPGKFSCIPTWVLSPGFKDEFIVVRDTYGQRKEIEIQKLRDLIPLGKLCIFESEDGKKYIPSFSYIKYFR